MSGSLQTRWGDLWLMVWDMMTKSTRLRKSILPPPSDIYLTSLFPLLVMLMLIIMLMVVDTLSFIDKRKEYQKSDPVTCPSTCIQSMLLIIPIQAIGTCIFPPLVENDHMFNEGACCLHQRLPCVEGLTKTEMVAEIPYPVYITIKIKAKIAEWVRNRSNRSYIDMVLSDSAESR